MLIFVAFLAMASATAVKFEKPEESQERTLVSSNGGNFLSLNSTTLAVGVVVLLGVAAVAIFAVGGLSPARIQQRYGQKYNDAVDVYSTYAHNRFRRFASNGR